MLTTFIFDNDNRYLMTLIAGTDSKTGIISAIPDDSTLNAQAKGQKNQQEKPAVITKTGNSKIIAGYRCDEYKVVETGEDGYTNVWMTKDIKIKADKRYWGKAGMPAYYGHPEFEGSMMLAFDAFDKEGKPEMKMETQEINENFKHSISTAGFSFIKMNFGQAGKKYQDLKLYQFCEPEKEFFAAIFNKIDSGCCVWRSAFNAYYRSITESLV
jgi:hypothetical protein